MHVFQFWVFFIGMSVAFTVSQRWESMRSKGVRRLFPMSVVGGFVVTTLANIRLFILTAITGNTDAPVGFGLAQTMINPLHFVIPRRLIYRLLAPLPENVVSCSSAIDMIPFELWTAIFIDLLMGSLFWAAVASVMVQREGPTGRQILRVQNSFSSGIIHAWPAHSFTAVDADSP